MASLPPEELVIHTLNLLEHRLHRLEFLLHGNDELLARKGKGQGSSNVTTRISRLQSTLGQLAARSRTVEQLLKLQAHHPDIFQKPPASSTADEASPTITEKFTLITSEAPLLSSTSSQLRLLSDLPAPPTSSFTSLISQTPRFAALQHVQATQNAEIAELRTRSAKLVARWYEVQVLGGGRVWNEIEGRMRDMERGIAREEGGRTAG